MIAISTTLPYSHGMLIAFMTQYVSDHWPFQLLALGLTGLLFSILLKASRNSGFWIACILSSFWLFCGVVFFYQKFSQLSFMAPVYAVCFVAEALLLLGVIGHSRFRSDRYNENKKEIGFRLGGSPLALIGAGLIFVALVAYPMGVFLLEQGGDSAPAFRTVGVTPVATALFTLGLLAMATNARIQRSILAVIPLFYLIAESITSWFLVRES